MENVPLLFWNVTGMHAERAAKSLGYQISKEGCERAVSELVQRGLQEMRVWDIHFNTMHRDDQLAICEIEKIFDTLQRQGHLLENENGWNLNIQPTRVIEAIESLPTISKIKNRLKRSMEHYPKRYALQKDRTYAVRIPKYKNLSLNPKVCVALMPILHGENGFLVFGEDVIERMLLLYLILSPTGCRLSQVVVHGMLLGADGKKMSRYASNALKSSDVEINPDVVRASILSRPITSNIRLERLQTAQAKQLRSQFERILGVLGKHPIAWQQPSSNFVCAVSQVDFPAIFNWLRIVINRELREIVLRYEDNSATKTEIDRAHAHCTLIGQTIFPLTYANASV